MSFPVEHVALEEASFKQLKEFATIMMGLEVPGAAKSKEDVRAIIETAGWSKDTIPTFQKSSDVPELCDSEGAPRPRTFEHNFNGKRMCECVAINIPETDKPGGQEPVPVSVNGSQMWIPRNERVVIPVEYVELLEHAEEFIYPETRDGLNEHGLGEPRVVKVYPFSYVA